jgi:hypothetical protein
MVKLVTGRKRPEGIVPHVVFRTGKNGLEISYPEPQPKIILRIKNGVILK